MYTMGSGSINQMISKLCVLRSWLIPPGTTPRIESPNCCNDSWVASPLLKNHKMTLPRDIYKAFYLYLGKTAHPKTSRVPRNSRKSWYPRTRHIPKIGLTRKFKTHDIQEIGTSKKLAMHSKSYVCIYIYAHMWCHMNVHSQCHIYTHVHKCFSMNIHIYLYFRGVYTSIYILLYIYIYYIHIYMYE